MTLKRFLVLCWLVAAFNRDGRSQPSELHSLADAGVRAIQTDAKESRRVDGWGNAFRYRAKFVTDDRMKRNAIDVFVVWTPLTCDR